MGEGVERLLSPHPCLAEIPVATSSLNHRLGADWGVLLVQVGGRPLGSGWTCFSLLQLLRAGTGQGGERTGSQQPCCLSAACPPPTPPIRLCQSQSCFAYSSDGYQMGPSCGQQRSV
eukprot:3195613-Rhodomonas_salina.1